MLVRIAASGLNPLDTKIRSGNAAHATHPLRRSVRAGGVGGNSGLEPLSFREATYSGIFALHPLLTRCGHKQNE
jgi:hypothetical protein